MIKIFLILILLTFSFNVFGQNCTQTEVSNHFIFNTSIKRIKTENLFDSCLVEIIINERLSNKHVQTINYNSTYLFEEVFENCNNVRSYSTGKNNEAEVNDNDFGDLVIADLNFDNKEDFAIKKNSGGNGGPVYDFYIQTKYDKFIPDKFLSDSMVFFPSQIVKSHQLLITLVHANALEMSETTFKLNGTQVWNRIKRRYLKY